MCCSYKVRGDFTGTVCGYSPDCCVGDNPFKTRTWELLNLIFSWLKLVFTFLSALGCIACASSSVYAAA